MPPSASSISSAASMCSRSRHALRAVRTRARSSCSPLRERSRRTSVTQACHRMTSLGGASSRRATCTGYSRARGSPSANGSGEPGSTAAGATFSTPPSRTRRSARSPAAGGCPALRTSAACSARHTAARLASTGATRGRIDSSHGTALQRRLPARRSRRGGASGARSPTRPGEVARCRATTLPRLIRPPLRTHRPQPGGRHCPSPTANEYDLARWRTSA